MNMKQERPSALLRWIRRGGRFLRPFAVGAALLLPGISRGDVTVDQLNYEIKSNQVTIKGIKSGIAPVDINGALNIPSTIDGYPVVAMAQNAF